MPGNKSFVKKDLRAIRVFLKINHNLLRRHPKYFMTKPPASAWLLQSVPKVHIKIYFIFYNVTVIRH